LWPTAYNEGHALSRWHQECSRNTIAGHRVVKATPQLYRVPSGTGSLGHACISAELETPLLASRGVAAASSSAFDSPSAVARPPSIHLQASPLQAASSNTTPAVSTSRLLAHSRAELVRGASRINSTESSAWAKSPRFAVTVLPGVELFPSRPAARVRATPVRAVTPSGSRRRSDSLAVSVVIAPARVPPVTLGSSHCQADLYKRAPSQVLPLQ
jgi:hypothetical protein